MVASVSAQSALRWDKKNVEVSPAPGEKTVRADFAFTNISNQPVTIDSVKSSCGCTTAVPDKKTYQPGEKGHITAVFTIGGRQGFQAKAIRVSVRGESEPTTLTMVTQVGETAKMDSSLVYWKVGDPAKPKTIRVKAPSGVKLTGVTSNNPKFSATLESSQEKGEYQIVVTPQDTSRPMVAVLSLEGSGRGKEAKAFTVYAQIKR